MQWKSFLLRLDVAEVPVWAACAKNKLLPLQLDEEERVRPQLSHLFITQRFWQLIYPQVEKKNNKIKNPTFLQKAWEAESGGFSSDRGRDKKEGDIEREK